MSSSPDLRCTKYPILLRKRSPVRESWPRSGACGSPRLARREAGALTKRAPLDRDSETRHGERPNGPGTKWTRANRTDARGKPESRGFAQYWPFFLQVVTVNVDACQT